MSNISKLNFIFIFNFIILIFAFNALAIDRNIPKTNEEWDKAWASLNWKKGPSVVNYNQATLQLEYFDESQSFILGLFEHHIAKYSANYLPKVSMPGILICLVKVFIKGSCCMSLCGASLRK